MYIWLNTGNSVEIRAKAARYPSGGVMTPPYETGTR